MQYKISPNKFGHLASGGGGVNDDESSRVDQLFAKCPWEFGGLRSELHGAGWKALFSHDPVAAAQTHCRPFTSPRWHQIPAFTGMAWRYMTKFYLDKTRREKKRPFIDALHQEPWRPIYGVPLGGLGSGTIGRGFRGEFCRSTLIPGICEYDVVPANQFILTVHDVTHCSADGESRSQPHAPPILHRVLTASTTASSSSNVCAFMKRAGWNAASPSLSHNCAYTGVYPRAWTVYHFAEQRVTLFARQVSPVLPHSYSETSLPCAVFVWRLYDHDNDIDNNNNDNDDDVMQTGKQSRRRLQYSITFTFSNANSPTSSYSSTAAKSMTSSASSSASSTVTLTEECSSNSVTSLSNNNKNPENKKSSHDMTSHQKKAKTFFDEEGQLGGAMIHQRLRDMDCWFGIGALQPPNSDVTVTTLRNRGTFSSCTSSSSPAGSNRSTTTTARDLWEKLSARGQLDTDCWQKHNDTTESIETAADSGGDAIAVCASGSSCSETELVFALTWHMPRVQFRAASQRYRRYYMRFLQQQRCSDDAMACVAELLRKSTHGYLEWERRITAWQRPVLSNASLPNWYKSALFNELYFVSDGGTLWLDVEQCGDATSPDNKAAMTVTEQREEQMAEETGERAGDDVMLPRERHMRQYGRFAYLEGHEYRMFNTYDVHYYASWALIQLWPRLQESVQYDVAEVTQRSDPTRVYFVHSGEWGQRSAADCVPHDVGDPEDEPWSRVNCYIMYDTDEWKDLNPKFVLQVFRDWTITHNKHYLQHMTPIALKVMQQSIRWDRDGDGIIENSGFADQTYDAWVVTGVSAYTGGLWLASLYAICELLRATHTDCTYFASLLEKARGAYHAKLWTERNGGFFKYDSSSSSSGGVRASALSVMSDQLNGHWYLKLCGVPDNSVFETEKVRRALQTIFHHNCAMIGEGRMGAVNGMKTNRHVDTASPQSEEFWVGVNYALASCMIAEALPEIGLAVAEGTYRTVWERFGLQFQTPEAYFVNGRFRSLGYMRPLAVWAMNHAFLMSQSASQATPATSNTTKKLNGAAERNELDEN